MTFSRRAFLGTTAAAGLAGFVRPAEPANLVEQALRQERRVFRHGVASGDPLSDAVILWTRVSAPVGATATRSSGKWQPTPRSSRSSSAARRRTGEWRDFTVKIDAGGLRAGTTYYYRFRRAAVSSRRSAGPRRCRLRAPLRVRLAVASCSNYPHGFFNVYARIARARRSRRRAAPWRLHLRVREWHLRRRHRVRPRAAADREIVALDGLPRAPRARTSSDPDLQEAHRQHPFIVVWDDHEFANNAWRGGAENHQPDRRAMGHARAGSGLRRRIFEWMPVREAPGTRQPSIYRTFRFGDLADLIMLDTRLIVGTSRWRTRGHRAVAIRTAR